MNICFHEIKQSEIVGIGPLLLQFSSDQVMRQLYKERKLFFELHLRNHTTRIESDWISFADHLTAEEATKNKKYIDEFKLSYEAAKAEIIKMIQ